MTNLLCRPATADDLDAIVELWVALMDMHRDSLPVPLVEDAADYHREHVRKMLDDDSRLVLVAELNGQVIGYLRGSVASYPSVFEPQRFGKIAELIVVPGHRRHGVGKELYRQAREWFINRGVSWLEVDTAPGNAGSNAFWARMGFEAFRESKKLPLK